MESNSQSKKINANAVEDRISSLSDEIISHILSFLPTKYAVATSVLSKRWRYLWTNVTNLLFDYYFPKTTDNESFHDFVDRVVHQCASKQIQRFYLRTYKAKFDRVQAWVDEALRRNVYELELNLLKFPLFISTCKTLTVLKLYSHRPSDFEIPTSIYLPSLRILSIEFRCPSNILTEKLFRSCPALEDLNAWSYFGVGKDSNFTISAPVLKRLRFRLDVKIKSNCKFVINAPNLEYMDIYNGQITDYEVRNLSSIAEARVDVGDKYFTFDGETMANRAVELLRGLSGVKSLSLGSKTTRALDHAYPHDLPIFHNMTRLELCGFVHGGRKILPRLLEVSPKLKVLLLQMGRAYYVGPINFEDPSGASDWNEPQSLPECLSSCLELVQIEMFLGNEYELKVVEYLLMHAAGLKKLTINPAGVAPETKVKFCQKLLEVPRSSRTCQVHLLG